MAIAKAKRSVRKKQSGSQNSPKPKNTQSQKLAPGELALQEKKLSDRHFVWFPLAKGKIIEKMEIFTTREYHCLRIDFQDQTFLVLEITPSFIINASYQQHTKDDPEMLAEWPPIKSDN